MCRNKVLLPVWHDSFTCETWRMHMWDMTRSHVNFDSFNVPQQSALVCVTWLIHRWDVAHVHLGHDSFTCETSLIQCAATKYFCLCDMTQSHVRRGFFAGGTWRIHKEDVTHSHLRHDSIICETWLIHMWDMTHLRVCGRPPWFIRVCGRLWGGYD